jgi:hypothetical protein
MGVFIFIVAIIIFFLWINSGSSSSSSSNSSRTTYNSNRHSSQPTSTTSTTRSISNNPSTKPTFNSTNNAPAASSTNKTTSNPHRIAPSIQSILNDSKVAQFTPISGINFSVSNNNGEYKWYALYNYYPVNRFNASDLSSKDLEARRHVFDFKDGRNSEYYAKLFASALINQFGRVYLKDKILLIVPASNKTKTEVRFKEFCRLLSVHTGLVNGYEMLTNNNLSRSSAHTGGNRNADLEQYLNFSGSFHGKHVIVIDDVRTSGSSSNKINDMLKRRHISSATFFYMAKTVSAF